MRSSRRIGLHAERSVRNRVPIRSAREARQNVGSARYPSPKLQTLYHPTSGRDAEHRRAGSRWRREGGAESHGVQVPVDEKSAGS